MLISVHHVDIRSAAPVLKSWKAVAKWKNTKCVKRASLCYAKTGLRRDCWVWNECATLARWCSPWAVLTSTWGIAHTYQCSANAVLPAFYEENMESMMVIARWRTWCVLAVPTTWGKTEKSTWKPCVATKWRKVHLVVGSRWWGVCHNVIDVNAVSTIIDLSLSLSEKRGKGKRLVHICTCVYIYIYIHRLESVSLLLHSMFIRFVLRGVNHAHVKVKRVKLLKWMGKNIIEIAWKKSRWSCQE